VFVSKTPNLATLGRMQPKVIAVIFTLLALFLWAGVSLCLAQDRLGSASHRDSGSSGATPVAPDPSPSPPSEGCKLGAYTGTTPLSSLQYYVAGVEDVRGGMTCIFRINSKLPLFTFHFADREDNTLGNLDITSGTSNEVIQTIENTTDPNAIAPAKAQGVLTAVDANFDGYQDLQLLISCGAKTCSYNFYLYDPKANQFVPDKFLGGLSAPSFDQAKKQVSQGWLLSAYDSGSETYQYENSGRYTLIRKEVSTWDRRRHTVTVSTYELRNGRMQLVDSKTTLQ
jgi:hypothetical protein